MKTTLQQEKKSLIDKERAKRILNEEQAVKYMGWLLVPTSLEFLRNAIGAIKKDKTLYRQEIKKLCNEGKRHIDYNDVNTAICSNDEEEIWAYDEMMTLFMSEMENNVNKIEENLNKAYQGLTLKEHLVNFSLAVNISRIHQMCLELHQKALNSVGSRLNISGAINLNKETERLSKGICELLEKKAKITLDEQCDEFNNVCIEYFKKIYDDEEMHIRIQKPLVEYNKKLDKEAEDKCGEILLQPISILELSQSTQGILTKEGVNKIGDLYENNGYKKINGIGNKRMEEIKNALKGLVLKMLQDTRIIQPL